MALAALLGLPTFVLIRPRAGDFCYGRRDVEVMLREIDAVREMRLAGVVIGASLADGSLDEATLRKLVEHAAGLPAVLHRAFDLVEDFQAGLEAAIGLGFRRVLTSGGAVDAPSGASVIRELVAQAGDRIEVMAGAGLSPANITGFVRETGVRAVHSSCSSLTEGGGSAVFERAKELGFIPANRRVTDTRVVAAMLSALTAS
jgi:copper homeostasis protein